MKYKFIGKPDSIFTTLETGKIYDLEVRKLSAGLFGSLVGNFKPEIYFMLNGQMRSCPYDSYESFKENWRRV